MPETISRQEAIETLRGRIIEKIEKSPDRTFQLADLLWADAASCFPEGEHWDGAWFKLDLETMKLHAEVSTYPSHYGSREARYPLTAAEFHKIAKKYNMDPVLQCFETDEDWAALFDDRLKTAAADARAILDRQEQERRDTERLKYAVVIPGSYSGRAPEMNLIEVELSFNQLYGSSSVKLAQADGYYNLNGVRLTNAQAAWVEDEVDRTIKNPDTSTWQSLPGGDRMTVAIKTKQGEGVKTMHEKPMRKYTDLKDKLQKLSQYGSRFEWNKPAEESEPVRETSPAENPQPAKDPQPSEKKSLLSFLNPQTWKRK